VQVAERIANVSVFRPGEIVWVFSSREGEAAAANLFRESVRCRGALRLKELQTRGRSPVRCPPHTPTHLANVATRESRVRVTPIGKRERATDALVFQPPEKLFTNPQDIVLLEHGRRLLPELDVAIEQHADRGVLRHFDLDRDDIPLASDLERLIWPDLCPAGDTSGHWHTAGCLRVKLDLYAMFLPRARVPGLSLRFGMPSLLESWAWSVNRSR